MSVATIHASAFLRRRAIAEDRLGGGGADDDDAYWASPPRLYDFSKHQPKDEPAQDQPLPPPPPPAPSPPSPKPEPPTAPAPSPPSPSLAPRAPAPSPPSPPSPTPSDAHLCLLALQGTGVSWGVRKRVHYVGRHRAARRADPAPAQPPAQSALAAAVDEESSSNVKTRSEPETKAEADGSKEEEAATVAAEKKKKRRRKPGRGLTFRPRKRARRERKPPAPKAEPVAVARPRAVADRSVAQVYAATEAEAEESKHEVERQVARTEVKRNMREMKDDRRRGVAKRPSKVLPKEEEAVEEDETSQDERKAAVVVKTERKKSRREEEDECGRDERKAVVVVKTKTERKKSRREEEESGRDERKAAVVVKAERKKGRREEADSGRDERKAVVVVKAERRTRRRKKEKPEPKTKPAPNNVLAKVEESGGKGRAMVDRWAAQRYATAEASLLSIVRSMGARAGKPVQRRQLREEARKRIGDTGLLDHLLKHTKDKVTPGGAERLRRRHNADGAMEYWLEPAEFAALRREAGVADPYWVPPPGWKLGDPVSPDACALVMKRHVEELATELAEVKRHMEKLMKAHPGTLSKEVKSETVKAYISHEPYQEKNDCLVKANGNLEKQVLSLEEKYASAAQTNDKLEEEVLFLKEKYEAVVERNNRLEEQMVALSSSFLSLKDELLFLNDGDGEQQLQLMEPDQAEHHLYLCAKESCEADKQESNGSGEAPDDAAALAVAGDGTTSSGGGGKRRSRKCSVRICKPQGAFQWPDAAHPSSPLTPTAAGAADEELLDEYMADGGLELPTTPPSASSTNASSSRFLLLPAPDSPVQPPLPPPSGACSSPRDVDLQAAAQPDPGPELQLRHTAQDAPSLPLPCGATASVGTELALATPTY